MNAAERQDLSYGFYLRRERLMDSKSHDYADADVLSNFKRVAKICRVWNVDVHTPAGCAEYLAILKLDRHFNLKAQGKDPANESVDDTFLDLFNYLDLLRAILHEQSALAQLEDIEKEASA